MNVEFLLFILFFVIVSIFIRWTCWNEDQVLSSDRILAGVSPYIIFGVASLFMKITPLMLVFLFLLMILLMIIFIRKIYQMPKLDGENSAMFTKMFFPLVLFSFFIELNTLILFSLGFLFTIVFLIIKLEFKLK